MASPLRSPTVVLRTPFHLAVSLLACACATAKPAAPPRHVAHGHAIATIERDEGEPEMMLERVEDEDTHWVELPHFGECPYEDGEVPPYTPVDDSDIPSLDAKRTRLTNMDAGEATIHNEALLQHLDRATAEVLACVSVSACYDDRALEPGSIELSFEVAPDGQVRGVNVEPTAGLDHTGIRPCARRAIWDTTFPAFDGADMVVSYSLDID
ncbi:MAG: hypothetical protein ACRBN8_38805 [Nannocystales bacterium]